MIAFVRRRWREIAVLLASTALLTSFVVDWASFSTTDRSVRDFTGTYAAAVIIRDGHAAQIYDWHVAARVEGQVAALHEHQDQYPITQSALGLALAVPLTWLSLSSAFTVWSALQLLLVMLAVVIAARAAPRRMGSSGIGLAAIAALALAGFGTQNLLDVGTSTGFNAIGVAMAYRCWQRRSYTAGGAWLAGTAMIAKPHLAVALLLFVLAWGNRRAIVGVLAGGAAALAAFTALVGVSGIGAFVGSAVRTSAAFSARGGDSFFSLPSMWFDDTTATYVVGIAGICLVLALCVVLGRRVRREPALLGLGLATATALSLLATPHAFLYDTVMVAPAVAWTLAELDLFGVSPSWRGVVPWVIAALWVPAIGLDASLGGTLLPLVQRIGELNAWWLVGLTGVLWAIVRAGSSGRKNPDREGVLKERWMNLVSPHRTWSLAIRRRFSGG